MGKRLQIGQTFFARLAFGGSANYSTEMATVVANTRRSIPQRPINRFSALDNQPTTHPRLATVSASKMTAGLGISPRFAKEIGAARRPRPIARQIHFNALRGSNRAAIEFFGRRCLLEGDDHVIITEL